MVSLTRAAGLAAMLPLAVGAAVLRVPQDHATLQTAIDAAVTGDTVLVSPGTYRESLHIEGKDITLASEFFTTGDLGMIERTVLLGGSTDGKKGSGPILSIAKGVTFATKVVGFTFRQGDHGVLTRGQVQVLNNHFRENRDALSCESGGAIVRGNRFEQNRDDGIDMDGASYAVVEDNVIRDNRDDGLELRLHPYSTGEVLEIVIRGNTFIGNGGDGVQLIDYPGRTGRTIRIERNLFRQNAMSAIGATADGRTRQDFQGSPLIEPVLILNNTVIDSPYGVVGGEAMLLLNNVFARISKVALLHLGGDSVAGVNLIWQAGTECEDCDLDQSQFVRSDPRLDADDRPLPGSPCLEAGAATIDFNGTTVSVSPERSSGKAPELGCKEDVSPSTPSKAEPGTSGRDR
ncbi:MAG: right-handed parallel beta-helix repeat-containing protein [Opitutaceae bacterium]|nr:right-handed parallel beta-helix repeat-containing protein [Opitutaceae bacterium]